MKKIIIFLLMTFGLNASEITWIESYKEAAKVAKTEDKPLLIFINRPDCGACKVMKEITFQDKTIILYINEHFIPVSLNIDKNDLPKTLKAEVTPTFHFVKYDGTKLRETLLGGKTGKFYLNILKEAVAAYK
jgi:thioredoxin-related protein